MMSRFHTLLQLSWFASAALAQQCPVVTNDVVTYPTTPLVYPMTSDRYSVQYQIGGTGAWTNAQVYASYYGGTNSSPSVNASGYPADESMSYVNIPAAPGKTIAVRVMKIWGSNFPALSQMAVRPTAKGIQLTSVNASTVQFSTTTAADFAGEQFVLRWTGTAQANSSVQGLGIFLNPPYAEPTGANVKVVTKASDLAGNLSAFDTLDIEGTVAVASTGAAAFVVPVNINNIFLGPSAWLQGKLLFTQGGSGNTRKIYGTGVLDVSRFNYGNRQCGPTSAFPDDGYQSISWDQIPAAQYRDQFVVDGVTIADSNYYATDWFRNSTLNNVKIIGWNGNNDGIQMGLNTRVSNVFVRTGDDSLKMWGSYITVTNATVWQNWNGGVINLGWSNNTPGDDSLIDGVYVVETDWNLRNTPSWTGTSLNSDNDAIIASLQVPGTIFGGLLPSTYRNIYVEDSPRALLSLKILPPDCSLNGRAGTVCAPVDTTVTSVLNLNLENIFTPEPSMPSMIGFQTVNGTVLPGTMFIGLTNIMVMPPNGPATALTLANEATLGGVSTNGSEVVVNYATAVRAANPPTVASGAVLNAANPTAGTPVAPGSIATVAGLGFGSSESGVTVLMGGVVAPLIGVTPQLIYFQVPWQLTGQTQAPVAVTSADQTSAPVIVSVANQAPGIFALNGSPQAAAMIVGTEAIAAPSGSFPHSRPARIGESIIIFCTGLGPVTNQPATGVPASGNPLSDTSGPVTVSIGGVNAPVSFSGLVPGSLGLYKVTALVASNTPVGSAVSVTIGIVGSTSNQATVAVGH